eukprot:9439958-Prorocentrum_lima.AAC.1
MDVIHHNPVGNCSGVSMLQRYRHFPRKGGLLVFRWKSMEFLQMCLMPVGQHICPVHRLWC